MTSVRQDLGRQLLTAVRWQRDDAEAARLVAAGADVMFDSGDYIRRGVRAVGGISFHFRACSRSGATHCAEAT